MRRLRAALACLTMLPVGPRPPATEQELGGSWSFFPLVGLLIGLLLIAAHTAASLAFSPLVSAGCALAVWVMITGALHLDGFGDLCDALAGGRTREDRLRIMKDPHVGAMAVVGLSTLLILKFCAIVSLPRPASGPALLLATCFGRYVMVLLGTTMRYARKTGTAAPFVRHARKSSLVIATVVAAAASWLIWPGAGLWFFALALAIGVIMRAACQWLLGGITGDALGAAGELTELIVLIVSGVSLG